MYFDQRVTRKMVCIISMIFFYLFNVNVYGNPEKSNTSKFILKSPAIQDGKLVEQYKCEKKIDGKEKSIPLSWENVPTGTKSLAIVMYHFPHKDDHTEVNSYLLLWGIDPSVSEIPHGYADKGDWYMGANKDGKVVSYTSPCSRGYGTHEYIITIFALSEKPVDLPKYSTVDVNYENFMRAIKNTEIIDQATLTFLATSNQAGERPAPPPRPGAKPENKGDRPQND